MESVGKSVVLSGSPNPVSPPVVPTFGHTVGRSVRSVVVSGGVSYLLFGPFVSPPLGVIVNVVMRTAAVDHFLLGIGLSVERPPETSAGLMACDTMDRGSAEAISAMSSVPCYPNVPTGQMVFSFGALIAGYRWALVAVGCEVGEELLANVSLCPS